MNILTNEERLKRFQNSKYRIFEYLGSFRVEIFANIDISSTMKKSIYKEGWHGISVYGFIIGEYDEYDKPKIFYSLDEAKAFIEQLKKGAVIYPID